MRPIAQSLNIVLYVREVGYYSSHYIILIITTGVCARGGWQRGRLGRRLRLSGFAYSCSLIFSILVMSLSGVGACDHGLGRRVRMRVGLCCHVQCLVVMTIGTVELVLR